MGNALTNWHFAALSNARDRLFATTLSGLVVQLLELRQGLQHIGLVGYKYLRPGIQLLFQNRHI